MKLFLRAKLYHLIFWLVYFVCWTFFSMRYNGITLPWAILEITVWFIGQATVLYTCIYVLVPRFFNKKRYGAFIISIVGVIIVSAFFISAGTVSIIRQITTGFTVSFTTFSLYAIMDNCFVAILAVAAKIIKDRIKNEQRTQLLEKEKTENELRFLRSQINPHFLFNAINSIYVLIKTDPEIAAPTLAKFADMLRYQLYECNNDEIPIEKEIAYLNNYIQMEHLRKGTTVGINYNIEKSTAGFYIAPLLIIPFVENAFKFVSAFTDRQNNVTINMGYRDNTFTLLVENTTDDREPAENDKLFSGIGLENVRRRLELIYNLRHVLSIGKVNGVHSVSLSIQVS